MSAFGGRADNGFRSAKCPLLTLSAVWCHLWYISYFSTLCAEQCQLKIICGRWSWQARRLEITDRTVVTLGKQKRVNILNRPSEEFKNRAFQ